MLESAICARVSSIFQRSERGGVRGGGAPPAATVLGLAAVQGGCTRGSGGEKIENFEKSQKCSEWLEMCRGGSRSAGKCDLRACFLNFLTLRAGRGV